MRIVEYSENMWTDAVTKHLDPLVNEEVEAALELRARIDAAGVDEPHPWSLVRCKLWLFEDDEDAFIEDRCDFHRADAEEAARDDLEGERVCCFDFNCPCGNTNNYRGG